MNAFKMWLLAVCLAATNSEGLQDTEEKNMARCVKMTTKFIMTRICEEQQLAVECLNIETPDVTEMLDYCYKELQYDPINLPSTLRYICSYEETIAQVADCLCRASKHAHDTNPPEEIEAELNETHENEDYEEQSYNTTMMHCLQYLNDIYNGRKGRFR